MRIKHRVIIFFVFFLLSISYGQIPDSEFRWRSGEELTYKVKWEFVRLGTVKLAIEDSLKLDSIPVHKITFHLDSNPLLFFVNMHSFFICYVDTLFRPILYIASEKNNGQSKKAVYRFNYTDSIFTIDFMKEDTTVYRQVTLPLKKTVFDGISLVFFARKHISEKRAFWLTAFWEDKLGPVEIHFKGKGKPIKIKSIGYAIPTYYTEGIIHLKGIAGVNGPFKGWFAADNQRPPLKAYLKVFIGNVTAELESWKKWSPPLKKFYTKDR